MIKYSGDSHFTHDIEDLNAEFEYLSNDGENILEQLKRATHRKLSYLIRNETLF